MHEEVQVWEPRGALSSCPLAATAALLPSGIKAPQPRAENQHSGIKALEGLTLENQAGTPWRRMAVVSETPTPRPEVSLWPRGEDTPPLTPCHHAEHTEGTPALLCHPWGAQVRGWELQASLLTHGEPGFGGCSVSSHFPGGCLHR